MSWRAEGTGYINGNQLTYAFDVSANVTCIIGPNGSGKSTILKSLCGLHQMHSGSFTIENHILYDSEKGINVPPEKRDLGYMPQRAALFPHLNVYNNVGFGLNYRNINTKDKSDRIEECLSQFRLQEIKFRKPQELSGGEAQQVSLARAWICRPAMLLRRASAGDEPGNAAVG